MAVHRISPSSAPRLAADQAAAAAVAVPQKKTRRRQKTQEKTKPKRQPRYHVVLWDDDHHTYQYVIEMMIELFHHDPVKSFEIARQVDQMGRAIVLTTTREHAELKRDQIRAYGKDRYVRNCPGSMFATVEPADDGRN